MAKDYFQDILPPNSPQGGNGGGRQPKKQPRRDLDVRPAPVVEEKETIQSLDEEKEVSVPGDTRIEEQESERDDLDVGLPEHTPAERSIRNIAAPTRRMRDDLADAPRYSPPMPKPRKSRRIWMWVVTVVLLAIVGILLLIALRGTSVSVIPRSHTVVFDETSRFTAYPQQNAASGTLAYTTQTLSLEDSEPVASSGTVHAESKASGNITVYNNYSKTPIKLIKNTRFQTDAGLIFRVPADVSVPAMNGTTAGQVSVTVVADQAGDQYNIQPSKLTIPGLKGSPEFDKVYALSSAAFTGGFSGDRPGVSDSAMAAGESAVRGRLEQKMRQSITALNNSSTMTFPELAQITYQDEPVTQESNGARINEKATAVVPLIAAQDLALAVAKTVSAETDNVSIRMVPGKDFGGILVSASSTPGTDPVQFQLTGQALLVWNVNAQDLAQALAGRDQSAFQTIVTGFPGIQTATARIEPFWSNSFPSDAKAIRVKISDPAAGN